MELNQNGEGRPVCSSTKEKIAASLRQLMLERPFQKITVRDLMNDSGMKRQSFYYHFQDTQAVLFWLCNQNLLLPLEKSTLSLDDWLVYCLDLLEQDRIFYRRAFSAGNQERIVTHARRLFSPRVTQLLFPGTAPEELTPQQQFVVEFGVQALFAHIQDLLNSRKSIDLPAARSNFHFLLETLHLDDRRSSEPHLHF